MNACTPIELVLSKLEKVTPCGPKKWKAICPAHDDQTPSLGVTEVSDGTVLLKCRSQGCNNADIVQAIGLTLRDLFPDPLRSGNGFSANGHRSGGPPPPGRSKKRIVQAYNYEDEDGVLLFQCVRYDPKGFSQRRPDPEKPDGWLPNLNSVRLVLYRLPEVIKAVAAQRPIYLAEGEKDADNLRSKLGLTGTTNPMGAEKWRSEYTHLLRGAHVVILPDNDAAGQKHCRKVAGELQGTAASVRVLNLPDLPPKGDVSDWIDAGGTREELERLAKEAPLWTPADVPPHSKTQFTATELQKMELPEPKWAIPGILPVGLTILAGKSKIGKSWLTLGIANAIAIGGTAIGLHQVDQGDVLYLALEDTQRRLKDRMNKLMGCLPWPERLTFNISCERFGSGGEDTVRAWLENHPGARLVIIDTLAKARRRPSGHGNAYDEDYEAISTMKALADEFGVAILIVHHTRKAAAPEDVFDEINGTTGISGCADGMWVLKRSRQGDGAELFITGRDVEEKERSLLFDPIVGTWIDKGDAQEGRMTEEQSEVLQVLKDSDEPLSPSDIAKRLGKRNSDSTRQLLKKMVDQGIVAIAGYGKYKITHAAHDDHTTHTTHSAHTSETVRENHSENHASAHSSHGLWGADTGVESPDTPLDDTTVSTVSGVSEDSENEEPVWPSDRTYYESLFSTAPEGEDEEEYEEEIL